VNDIGLFPRRNPDAHCSSNVHHLFTTRVPLSCYYVPVVPRRSLKSKCVRVLLTDFAECRRCILHNVRVDALAPSTSSRFSWNISLLDKEGIDFNMNIKLESHFDEVSHGMIGTEKGPVCREQEIQTVYKQRGGMPVGPFRWTTTH